MEDEPEETAPLFDDFTHQSCYVFKPRLTQNNDDERPAKRTKLDQNHNSSEAEKTWPRLCAGKESLKNAKERQYTFQKLWVEQEEKIYKVMHQVDQGTLQRLVDYAYRGEEQSQERLRTALLVSRSDNNVQGHLIQELESQQTNGSGHVIIRLSPNQAPNLQSALKNIIRASIITYGGVVAYSTHVVFYKRRVPMNFDLELLQIYAEKNKLKRIVVSMLDAETFDLAVLSDLLSMLSSWVDRIKFTVILGLATTVELFESRLSTSIIRILDAEVFELHYEVDQPYRVFDAVQNSSATALSLGPSMINALVDMTQDQGQKSASLTRALKYTYMSHFFANPLSILLSESRIEMDHRAILCAAIRQTDSFQEHCKFLEPQKYRYKEIPRLLKDDGYLLGQAQLAVDDGQYRMRQNTKAFQIFHQLYRYLHCSPISSFELDSQLYNEQPTFKSSDFLDIIIGPIRQLHPESLLELINQSWLDVLDTRFKASGRVTTLKQQRESLESFLSQPHETTSPVNTTTSRSSISPFKGSQSVESHLPADPAAFTSSFISLLEECFIENTTSHTALFLHEAFVFNLKSPLVPTMIPRPRYALERALERPGDYLGCECCSGNGARNHHHDERADKEGGADATHSRNHKFPPPTSVLYNLLDEAGAIINVKDLWDAFRERIMPMQWASTDNKKANKASRKVAIGDGDDDTDGEAMNGLSIDDSNDDHENDDDDDDDDDDNETNDDNDDNQNNDRHSSGETEDDTIPQQKQKKKAGKQRMTEALAMALFYQALAELKMMGLVKQSKRKPGVECIAKTTWKGL